MFLIKTSDDKINNNILNIKCCFTLKVNVQNTNGVMLLVETLMKN